MHMHRFSNAGVSLAYVEVPAAEGAHNTPVLLIHGFASNIRTNWVNPAWFKSLGEAGYRVIALDNRGHGHSDKLYELEDYATERMAEDARALLDHLGIARACVAGYSMGARIAAFLALAHPERVMALALGGLGIHLVDGVGLPMGIADALEAASLDDVSDPMGRMFRAFAEQTKSDRRALAACIRGSRQSLTAEEAGRIRAPTLIAVGTEDPIAGAPEPLAVLMRHASVFPIVGRDHNLAVGDKTHRARVVAFFDEWRAR